MDEDMDMSVDTSDVDTSDVDVSDVDTSDVDTSDISDDIPEDDYSEDDYSDDYADDISEDNYEDEVDDYSDEAEAEIFEDINEEDAGDYSDDVEDEISEDNMEYEDDMDDSSEDIAEDTGYDDDDSNIDTEDDEIPEDTMDEDDFENDEFDDTATDTEDTISDDQSEVTDEAVDDTASEETEDTTADTEDIVSDDQNEVVQEFVEDTFNSVLQDTGNNDRTESSLDESTEATTHIEKKELEESDNNSDELSDIEEKSAQDRMSDYMNSHNYGLDDRGTYMSDTEWIGINRDLKAELGIPQTPQEQMMDYMGSHNYGIWDRDTYMRDPEWQALNAQLQNENAGKEINDIPILADELTPEEKGRISTFFSGLFGNPSQDSLNGNSLNQSSPVIQQDEFEDMGSPRSQILQEPTDTNDSDIPSDFVNQIENMNYNDLSDENKDLLYNTAKKHIGEKYGDLVSEDRLEEIPKHIKIADTEECRKAYEASGGKYSDNTVGFYCPATDEIYVDAPRNGDMTEIMATIEHESLHLASNGGLNGALEVLDGVSSYRRSTNLNEGVTELYAMRDMADMGFDYKSTSYQQQVDVVRALEDAMGKDIIKEAYFGNKPDLLRSEFESAFASEDELKGLNEGKGIHNGKYIDFLNDFDRYISTHPRDPDYAEHRDKVYNWIADYKSKRRTY